jgi:hypothetical protein
VSLGGTTPPGEGVAPGGTTPPTQQVIDLTSEPTIPTLGPLVPVFDRVPIEQAREAMRGYIALAIALRGGLNAQDLRAITGYKFAVRPILDAHPAFVRDEEGRWHLGIPARLLLLPMPRS